MMNLKNGTCALSKLPIRKDDNIICIIMTENNFMSTYHGTVNSSEDIYVPITVPFQGRYDDNGNIKNIIDENNTVFNQLLNITHNTTEFNTNNDYGYESVNDLELDNLCDIIRAIKNEFFPELNYVIILNELYYDALHGYKFIRSNEDQNKNYYDLYNHALNEIINAYDNYTTDSKLKNVLNNNIILCRFSVFGHLGYYKNIDIIKSDKNRILNLILLKDIFQESRTLWYPQIKNGSFNNNHSHMQSLIAHYIIEDDDRNTFYANRLTPLIIASQKEMVLMKNNRNFVKEGDSIISIIDNNEYIVRGLDTNGVNTTTHSNEGCYYHQTPFLEYKDFKIINNKEND